MRARSAHLAVLGALLLLAVPGWAQIEPIHDLPLTMFGEVGFGLSRGTTSGGGTAQQLLLTTAGNLSGYYHNPRFLQFTVNPNYRWNRSSNSGLEPSSDGTQGVSAQATFLSGGTMPITFHANIFRSSSASLGGGAVPVEIVATGWSKELGASWSMRREKLPHLSANYSWGDSEHSVTGITAPEVTTGHSAGSILGNYMVYGFRLVGGYSFSRMQQGAPDVLDLGLPHSSGKSRSSGESFSLDRSLPLRSQVSASVAHNVSSYDVTGIPLDQKFDTASVTGSTSFVRRLALNFSGNYTSNTAAELAAQLFVPGTLTAGPPTTPRLIILGGRSLGYAFGGSYTVGRGVNVQGGATHTNTHQPGGLELITDSYNGTVTYGRPFKRGRLNLSYSPSVHKTKFEAPRFLGVESFSLGHSATTSYMRNLGRFQTQSGFRYTQNSAEQNFGVAILTRSFGGDFRAATRLWRRWNVLFGGTVSDSQIPGFNNMLSWTVNGTMANRTWSFSGQAQFSSGYALLTSAGLTSTNLRVLGLGVPTLYLSNASYSATGGYSRRRLTMSASFSKGGSNMTAMAGPVEAGNSRFEARFIYKLRKIEVRGGLNWLTQMTSSNAALDLSQRTFWFDIVRPFRLF